MAKNFSELCDELERRAAVLLSNPEASSPDKELGRWLASFAEGIKGGNMISHVGSAIRYSLFETTKQAARDCLKEYCTLRKQQIERRKK